MTDIAHTFRAGHSIMVQVQSTWFPLAERNPQQFVDVWNCRASDFVPCRISLLHQRDNASSVTVWRLRRTGRRRPPVPVSVRSFCLSAIVLLTTRVRSSV